MAALLIGALSGASPFVPPPTAHGAAAAFFPPPQRARRPVAAQSPPPQQQQQQQQGPSLDPREQEPRRKKGQPERCYTLDQWRTGLYAVAAEHAHGSRIKVGAQSALEWTGERIGRLMMCTD